MELNELYLQFTFDLVATRPGAHLHWGLWDGIPHEPQRLPEAQEQYAERVRALLPPGRVVDVGCGLGGIAVTLDDVLCLTPLASQADKVRGLGIDVVCTRFEEWEGKADTLLFAESFAFFLDDLSGHLARCRQAAHRLVVADLFSDTAWKQIEDSLEIEEVHDVTELAQYTIEALQWRFEQTQPWDRLIRGILRAMDPELADRVDTTLATVPNKALETLLGGRMVEQDLIADRRYLLFRARL